MRKQKVKVYFKLTGVERQFGKVSDLFKVYHFTDLGVSYAALLTYKCRYKDRFENPFVIIEFL